MARPVTLFTGQWADLPLSELAAKTGEWGFDGLELACWGDHFDPIAAVNDSGYASGQRKLLEQHGLGVWAIGCHLVGQAVADPIDGRHQSVVPPDVWGDGDPEGVRQRAADYMKDAARAASALGVDVVTGFTGSPVWHLLYSFPPNDWSVVEAGYQEFAERWGPIIDVYESEGVKFALEVHPTEIAYDFVHHAQGARRAGRPPGLRHQLRPEPLRAPVPRLGGVHHGVRRRRSTTRTSRTRSAGSTAGRRSSAAISTSASPAAAGTSSRPATATSTSSR